MLYPRSVVVPQMRPEKKQSSGVEDDENGLFHCKLMRTKWNLIIENKIRIER
jgi:hypothetical protein